AVLASVALVALGLVLAKRGADPRRLASWIALAAVLPLPWIASDPLDAAPASGLSGTPPVLAAERKPEGRVFVTLHDPSLLGDWIASSGAAWRPDVATRAHAALAGYANLMCGVATATSPSPIGNPRVTRLLGAALQGGNPAAILALADVGAIVTPFPARFPGARLDRRLDGVSRYELPGRVGRVFFARSVEVADDDAAFAALRRPDFDPEARAYVADASAPLPHVSGPGYSVARVEADAPEELRVLIATGKPRFLVVTRSFDPGWHATLDGSPVAPVRTDLAFFGLAIPAGQHRLVLRYRPASYRVGTWISGISCLVFVSFWLAGGPRR
ncbi:MAG TPA: YfhO family protein, partial [Thermoanaerobaculia bacterium]|nr:YfhO family protein [Thermoanaerobaculia bacterium]